MRHALQRRGVPPQDVDDIIQEAFQRFETYRQTRPVESPVGFLIRTAVNISVDAARRKRIVNFAEDPVENHVIVDETPRPDEVYAARKRLDRLNDGFAAL